MLHVFVAVFNIPPAYIFIGVLILLVFILPAFKNAARKKARSEAFSSMGFLEVPAEQAFESPKAAARLIHDSAAYSIKSPVGRGTSALGETVIFELSEFRQDNLSDVGGTTTDGLTTVVGFRVPAALPDFEIRHTLLLDGLSRKSAAGANPTQPATVEHKFGPFKVVEQRSGQPVPQQISFEDQPAFAKKYVVHAVQEELTRRMITPALRDALVATNDGRLNIRKRQDWLFIYRGEKRTSPKQYPELLETALGLASKLDLRAATPTA